VNSRSRRPLGRFLGWTALAGIAGLVLATGAVLDWSSLSLESVRLAQTGLDSGGGVVTALFGLVLLVATITRISSYTRGFLAPVAIVVGVLSGLIIVFYVVTLYFAGGSDSAAPVSSLGAGTLLTALGSITAVVSGLGLIAMDRRGNRGSRRR
jgi:hypothetical protein